MMMKSGKGKGKILFQNRPVSFNLSAGAGLAIYDGSINHQTFGKGPHLEAGGAVCLLGDIVCGSAAFIVDRDVATTYQLGPAGFAEGSPHRFYPSNNTPHDQGWTDHNDGAPKVPPLKEITERENSNVTRAKVGVMIDVARMIVD